jgi:hypothetical protein
LGAARGRKNTNLVLSTSLAVYIYILDIWWDDPLDLIGTVQSQIRSIGSNRDCIHIYTYIYNIYIHTYVQHTR